MGIEIFDSNGHIVPIDDPLKQVRVLSWPPAWLAKRLCSCGRRTPSEVRVAVTRNWSLVCRC